MRKTKHGFKNSDVSEKFLSLVPDMFVVLSSILKWCDKNNLPCIITSALREFAQGQISNTHPEGRAIDISINGWMSDQIDSFVNEFNSNDLCKKYGAIRKDLTPCLVVYHKVEGGAFHLHIQVRPDI